MSDLLFVAFRKRQGWLELSSLMQNKCPKATLPWLNDEIVGNDDK